LVCSGGGVPAACATAGSMLIFYFIFIDRGGLLALGVCLVSCCMRYRGFDVGFTFYFH